MGQHSDSNSAALQAPAPPQANVPAGVTQADLQHLAALWTPEWPEVWREMSRTLYTALLANPSLAAVDRAELASAAVEQMTAVAELYGGAPVYMPTGHFLFKSEKAKKIIAEYKGRNLHEVARANEVTPNRVRQIVGAWQRAQFAARQGTLDLGA